MDLLREIADRLTRVNNPSYSKDEVIHRSTSTLIVRNQMAASLMAKQGREMAKYKPLLPKDIPINQHAETDDVQQTRFLSVLGFVIVLTLFSTLPVDSPPRS